MGILGSVDMDIYTKLSYPSSAYECTWFLIQCSEILMSDHVLPCITHQMSISLIAVLGSVDY